MDEDQGAEPPGDDSNSRMNSEMNCGQQTLSASTENREYIEILKSKDGFKGPVGN